MRLLHDVWQLMRSWWRIDRIRISPTEGHLLRCDPPCVVFVDGTPVEILHRLPPTTGSTSVAEFDCRLDGCEARLIVSSDGAKTSTRIIKRAKYRNPQRVERDTIGHQRNGR